MPETVFLVPGTVFRSGQLVATVGMLGEDTTGRSLWDMDDDELAAAVDRFAKDLSQRTQ